MLANFNQSNESISELCTINYEQFGSHSDLGFLSSEYTEKSNHRSDVLSFEIKLSNCFDEAKEILRDSYTDNSINTRSVEYGIKLLEEILRQYPDAHPDFEVHPDKEFSIIFRNEIGILCIAFADNGYASYAAYFDADNEQETHKGKFCVKNKIPRSVATIIENLL